ncbi:MAG: hypothetical protein NTW86_06180 [Candidatus Sumerlaeota bacterium]|nr:hypothetical protein [Candidatus Sumerlaeota bacterium]
MPPLSFRRVAKERLPAKSGGKPPQSKALRAQFPEIASDPAIRIRKLIPFAA